MKRKIKRGCFWAFVAIVVVLAIWVGPVIRDLWKSGILGNQLSAQKMREYQGNSMENLKALHTALLLYHDSEEAFPDSSGWMDAITNRIKAGDMTQEEADKKFVNPLIPKGKGVFGYAMNDLCSKKYKDDIKDPATTPLLFDSSDTSWNAHGLVDALLPKPKRAGGNMGISVTGEIIHFK
jgi:hypothetical protein